MEFFIGSPAFLVALLVLSLTCSCGGSAGPSAGAATDTRAPTQPTGLVATPLSSSQIHLSWSASSDDTGVIGYRVLRDGAQVGTSPSI